jgi:pyruvate dehydrogenase E1 component
VPCVRAYDVAYAYELALIVEDGLRRMLVEEEDVIYYITLQNEAYGMPAMPEGVREGVLSGIYRLREAPAGGKHSVQLFGSGSILNQVLRAQHILQEKFDVAATVWSVTSYQGLRSDALAAERSNRLHPADEPRIPFITRALSGVEGPFIAATDYMKSVAENVSRWIPGRFVPLGTDGFGLSDTRDALRRHFEVDAESIVVAALDALRLEGKIEASQVQRALDEFEIDTERPDPVSI